MLPRVNSTIDRYAPINSRSRDQILVASGGDNRPEGTVQFALTHTWYDCRFQSSGTTSQKPGTRQGEYSGFDFIPVFTYSRIAVLYLETNSAGDASSDIKSGPAGGAETTYQAARDLGDPGSLGDGGENAGPHSLQSGNRQQATRKNFQQR